MSVTVPDSLLSLVIRGLCSAYCYQAPIQSAAAVLWLDFELTSFILAGSLGKLSHIRSRQCSAPANSFAGVNCIIMALDSVVLFLQPHYTNMLGSLPAPVAEKLVQTLEYPLSGLIIASAVLLVTISFLSKVAFGKKKRLPPTIPGGLPLLGNILQLREQKPHRTFTEWAAKYGPIYHVKTGSINNVVITSAELAKEIMVTKYASVSTRKMSTALGILTREKTMVAMSDYGDEHRMLKKMMITNLLGPNPQRANKPFRQNALTVMLDDMFEALAGKKSEILDVREYTKHALFPFAMQQIFGYVPEGVHVPQLGRFVDKWEIFDSLVIGPLKMAIQVDWRNFFPALSFIPNPSLVNPVTSVTEKRSWIVDALIEEQRKILNSRGPTRCYADILLTEAKHLSPAQLQMSIWEPIIESADTTLVTTEWAMYEIARNPKVQERLYKEIKSVVGDRMVTEDDLDKFPYLTAIIQETLRFYAPVPVLPPRYVHDDITIGGYDIPKDWEVLINIWGINNDPKVWPNPGKWDPERLVNDKAVDLGFKDFRIIPFGGGKRMCAGVQQAMYIIPMNIAAFVLHFEWSLPPVDSEESAKKVEDTTFLTTHKLHPLKAVAKARVNGRIKDT